MLPKRSKLRKRIRLQFRGIRLLSPQKRKPEPEPEPELEEMYCGVAVSELCELCQEHSHRIDVLKEAS